MQTKEQLAQWKARKEGKMQSLPSSTHTAVCPQTTASDVIGTVSEQPLGARLLIKVTSFTQVSQEPCERSEYC